MDNVFLNQLQLGIKGDSSSWRIKWQEEEENRQVSYELWMRKLPVPNEYYSMLYRDGKLLFEKVIKRPEYLERGIHE